jgi:hypothetical protein
MVFFSMFSSQSTQSPSLSLDSLGVPLTSGVSLPSALKSTPTSTTKRSSPCSARRQETPIEAKSFKIRTSAKQLPNPFRMNTYKTKNLNSFRIRTYEKTGKGSLPSNHSLLPIPSTQILSVPRPSTCVPSSIQSILYPQSYCSLDRSRIHSPFNQEVCLDRFRTPHYATLPNAAPAHRPLDHRRRCGRN